MSIDLARQIGVALDIRSETKIRLLNEALLAYVRLTRQAPTTEQVGSIDASQVVSGTLANARISEASVTQHQAAFALAAAQITSGTFADARISESSVTQHEAALEITELQISDLGNYPELDATETISGAWTFTALFTVNAAINGLIADFGTAGDATTATKYARIRSAGFAGLSLQGDAGNGVGEPGGAWIKLTVDGFDHTGSGLLLARNQSAGGDGKGGSITNSSANASLVGETSSNPLEFFTDSAVRLRLSAAGNAVLVGGNSLYISERASAGGDTSGFGQLWVRSSDNALMYTGSDGTDNVIAFV